MSIMTAEIHRLGPIDSIPPGEGRAFLVGGREVAVFRTRGGDLFATQARCPHKGAPLADGLVGDGKIVCPFHAYAFELRTGEPVMNACPSLETHEVRLEAGEIVLALSEVERRRLA